MAQPSVTASIAFVSDPDDVPTWTDVTALVQEFSWNSGRQTERDRFETGSGSIRLDNLDRRFEPGYAGDIVNLIINPSIEVAATGYTATSAAVARSTSAGYLGVAGLRVTTTNVTSSGARSAAVSTTVGITYTFSAYVRLPAGGTKALKVSLVYFTSAVGSGVSGTSTTFTATGTWQRVQVSLICPPTATVAFCDVNTNGAVGVFDFDADAWQLEVGSAATDYIDGAQDNGRWAGTAHASQSYRGGPYYPYVQPLKRVRVQATWNAVTYDIWHGYVERWGLQYPQLDADAVVSCVDGQGLLMDVGVTGSFGPSEGGAYIAAILNAAGWPAADRSIDTSQNVLPASTLVSEPAMSHLLKVAEAENANMFISRAGAFTFKNRHARLQPDATSAITFGQGGGSEELYQAIGIEYDNTRLFTAVSYARVPASDDDEPVTQELENATGVSTYLRRTLSKSGLLNLNDAYTYMTAYHDLARQRAPGMRIASLVLDAESDPATLWPHLLGRDVGDRITVKKLPPGGGTAITQVSHIERRSITWTADGGRWGITWALSPADTTQYWLLGDATYGVLGSTTRLAY